jgi:hypothetical protein
VKRHVDKKVAHLDGGWKESLSVSWEELNTAVDSIEKTFARYYELLTLAALMIDDIVHKPWQHIFWEPWTETPENVRLRRAMLDELRGESEDP